MNSDFSILVEQMKIIASLIFIGFAGIKSRLFNEKLTKSLSDIISRIILPLMLVTIVGSTSNKELFNGIPILFATIIMYTLPIIITYKLRCFYPVNEDDKKMHSLLQCFGNAGYIGIPLITTLFSDSAGIVAASYLIVDATFFWVVGPAVLSGGKINLKKLISPITVSIYLGLLICILGFDFNNNILWKTAKDVGGTCKYFASIYIGMTIASMNFKDIKDSVFALASVPVKLLLLPLIAYFVFGKTGFLSGDILTMFIILSSTPSGMSLPVVADIAENSGGKYASAGIMVSTLLCLFTIPFIVYITGIF